MRQFVNGMPAAIRGSLEQARSLGFHILIVTISAAIALFLPVGAGWFLSFWAQVENEKMVVIALEVTVAATLILIMNFIWYSLRDRKRAGLAEAAGLVAFSQGHSLDTEGAIRELQNQHSLGRTLLAIGTTGYGTFVEEKTELSGVLANCLEAKLLLMNPFTAEAQRRARALWKADLAAKQFRDELAQTVEQIKRVRSAGKVVRLKLYTEQPHVKLVIMGDYLWLQHYHSALDVRWMPGYLFQHNVDHHGLYALFYDYFTKQWENPDIPEYDFQTDELIVRHGNGNEIRREPLGIQMSQLHEL